MSPRTEKEQDIAQCSNPGNPVDWVKKPGGHLYLPDDFDELRLYTLLRRAFGPPNGPLSFLGHPGGDPDGPFKWDFAFMLDNGVVIHVIRTSASLEVRWHGANLDRQTVLRLFESSLEKHSLQIDNDIGHLEKYSLMLNPYVRHRRIADQARCELDGINPSKPKALGLQVTSEAQIRRWGRAVQKYRSDIDHQAMVAMQLVTESAFFAESFLNMLLAVFMRPEIRDSKRIFTETLHRPWQRKIERLPLDCIQLVGRPDLGDVRIRNAKTVFETRNRVAHSYPLLDEMKIGEMWFDGRYPVLGTATDYIDFAFVLNNQLPSHSDAIQTYEHAMAFIEYLTELIRGDVRDTFLTVANAQPIGWNHTKGVYGVPFGDATITFVMLPRST